MSGGWDYSLKCLLAGRIAAGLGDAQLLDLPIAIGWAEYPAVALLASGATHCFLSEQIAQLANLQLNTSVRLDMNLVNGEQWVCLVVAHEVHVTSAWGNIQCWDFCVVPLAMALILSLLWLQ